ncbi:MAG: family 16 glycosylhydrolase [Nitrospiraceae bacterium]|nr:family 16 glycosylhydrolase [Nitrospiraceae bacterium]
MRAIQCGLAVLVLVAASGCVILPYDDTRHLPSPGKGKMWRLVWKDEFDGTEIDPAKWEVLGDWERKGGYWVREDAALDGRGNLALRTKRDGDRYTCGAVRSMGKFEQRYGFWEARCRFPTQPGHWPAFWLFSSPGVGIVGNEGRDGTEIDIMEKPTRGSSIQHALHWDGYGEDHRLAFRRVRTQGLNKGYHTFALQWTPEEYVFYVDGEETWRTSAGGVSQVPAYVKLTEEIGDWGGDITKAQLPDYFYVDYVRVYEAVAKDRR